MAVQFQEDDAQHSLRVGDTVLLYMREANGFVFSELSSEQHNSVALFKADYFKEPNLPNVHFATFKVVTANKYKAQERFDMFERQTSGHKLTPSEKGLMLQLKKDVEHELEENNAELERLQGSNLVYGEKIQLLHTASKKYLAVNTTKTSRTENTNLRVELASTNSQGCIFKILPRYKVRSVGDEVRYNDQVKLESVKTEGQFLHCSSHRYKEVFSVLEHCFELNLSATESALTIVSHYRPFPSHDPKALRGGGVVRLFHRERECYVSAEGSFAENPAVVEDVHCRKRHSELGRLKDPSTSANVYWQFEKESDGRSGEPLSWGERCRIKHLPTRLYLAVICDHINDTYTVTLKERSPSSSFSGAQSDLETVFSLFPVIQEKDTILVESYARIKHLQTRRWLHLEKGSEYVRSSFDPRAAGLKGLEWDSAELFRLTATETMNYDDAFTLELVDEHLLDNFNFVAGIVPILTTHINKYSGDSAPSLDSRNAYLVKGALQKLSSFMSTPNEKENKDRQKLLRNLRVLELVIKGVLGLFKINAKDESEQRAVCQGCYGVIKSYLNGDSRKNENYLARFVSFFKTQVRMGLNAEEVMIEMVEDNSAIVSKMAETEIDYMIQQLVETRDPRFMDFLGNLCVCEGRAIPSTQDTILKKLVYEYGKDVFYTTTVGGSSQHPEGREEEVYARCPGDTEWTILSDLVGKDDACEFLESQLNLFARICWGNNKTTIYALDKDDQALITFEQTRLCAKNPSLKPSLRSKYVKLMIVMYVDVGDNRNVLENLSLSFVYDKVVENPYEDTGGEDTVALTGVENIYFPAMRDWIKDHIQEAARKKVVAANTEENELLADIIEVLNLLVKYGYYDDTDDVEDVLRPLLEVMNGFTDVPFSLSKSAENAQKKQLDDFTKTRRFTETEENKPIFDIKARVMEVVDLFFNFRLYVRLQRFIYDFRVLKGDYNDSQHGALERLVSPNTFELAMAQIKQSRPPAELSGLQSALPDQISNNQHVVQLARERLLYIFSLSAYFFEKDNFSFDGANPSIKLNFPDILVDISNYGDPRLFQNSLYLLNRYYSSEVTLFEKAIQTQLLIAPKSCEVFNDISGLLPVLRRYMSIDVDDAGRTKIIEILRTFTKMCHLQEEDEPHPQNQKILYNYGLFSDVLNYVLRISKSSNISQASTVEAGDGVKSKSTTKRKKTPVAQMEGEDSSDVGTVCVECFKFLKALAMDYVDVQERLYDFMGDLLEVDIGIAAMAEVIAEIFTGGYELCLKVREDQVASVFSLVAQGELPEGRPELLNALQAMAKVEELDLPVKRNQAFIVTYFSKTREKFCDHLLGEGEKKREERKEMLIKAEPGDPDVGLLVSLTDLLASCSEGENLFIESVCQTVFSVDELLDIIDCDFIVAERKRPFARFLVSVYLATASDKFSSGASTLTSKDEMWLYLEQVATFMSNIGKVLKKMPSSEKSLVRQGLSSATRRYSASVSKRARTPRTQSMAIPFITGEDGRLLPGVLLYFSDGLLPLLRAYYESFFDPPKDTSIRERQMSVSAKIATALLEMAEVLAEHLTEDTQVKLYRGTVLTILKKCGEELHLEVGDEVLTTFDLKTKDCVGYETLTKKLYKDTYAEEIELNETFNAFVTNFKLAYQGPNTAQAQIGSKYDTPYSEGDEWLPLGPSFQQHVACFVNHHTSRQRDLVRPCVERLLAQLEYSFSQLKDLEEEEKRRQDELDIKSLQIMRAIVHNEIMNIDPELKENSPPGFRKRCISKVQPIQNSIQELGNAVSRVVPLLSHTNDEIVREVLTFLKAMLYSGNSHVQEGLNTVFDTREERLFTTMASLLKDAAITYNERRSLLSQVEARCTSETLLKENAQALVSSPPQQAIQHQPVDISIDIEVSGINNNSPTLSGHNLTSFAPLEESLVKEKEAASEEQAVEGEQRRPSSFNIPPKPHRRQSKKPAVTQLFQLETLRSAASAAAKEVQSGKGKEIADMLVKFKDSHHVKLALRVLGLMCDGQYRLMQNYLREQKDNLASVNVVGEVALFIQNFSHDINSETMDLVHLILQTLIEMCVGNYPNQLVIYNRQIIEALNHIFALDVYDEEAGETRGYEIKDVVNLKGSAVELLEAMLEETNAKTKDLVGEIVNSLQIDALHDNLAEFYSLMNDPKVKKEGFDDEAETGMFRTYHVLVHLKDYEVSAEKIEPTGGSEDDDLHKAWNLCKRHSKSVEVFYRNMDDEKVLTKIHFPFNPDHELREEVIEKVKWSISRDSPEDKLRDLLEWMKAVKRDTVHSARLQRFLPTKILTAFPQTRYYLLVLWSFLMSIFTLMAFMVPTGLLAQTARPFNFFNASGALQPDFLGYWRNAYKPVLYSFGSIHLVLSIWMVLEYFIINWPNFRLPSFFYSLMTRLTKRDPPEETYSDISVFGLQTIYVVVFLLCSILSLIFDGYFYCICLLHIIVNNDILQRVLKSVTKNGKSLLWVAALGVVVLYIYAVVSFAFLHEAFQAPGNDDATLFCSTLYECFASTIRYGLIDNLGLVVPLVPEEFSVSALRLLYDVSFFIIVTTIGLNIVFGIIVDTFSELRDERFRTEEDKKNACFICSLASHEFERRADGFDHHVKHDHNMWEYIYLSIYLDQIDISDHNAIQKFVYDMIRAGKIEFFPLLHALVLEVEEDETGQQLDALKKMVERVLKRFEEEEHQKSLRSKRQEQRKWEEQNLRQEPSFDARMSIDSTSAGLIRSASLHPRTASLDYRQPSFDLPLPPQQELPSDEL